MEKVDGVIAIIPARGGSKGLPRKNILKLGGKPLIAWTIHAALESGTVDRVVVSTDDEEIAEVSQREGAEVPFLRPAHLATETAKSVDVMRNMLEAFPHHETAILLQPTSPFRTGRDIDKAIDLFKGHKTRSCTSVYTAEESPYLMFYTGDDHRLTRVLGSDVAKNLRRQDLSSVVLLNGAIYIVDVPTFLKDNSFIHADTVGYLMPRERSIDIDTEEDFADAAETLKNWGGIIKTDP